MLVSNFTARGVSECLQKIGRMRLATILDDSLQAFVGLTELSGGANAGPLLEHLQELKGTFKTLACTHFKSSYGHLDSNVFHEILAKTIVMKWQGILRVITLSTWALAHWHKPYPNRAQQTLMAAFTGRSRQQVSDWFTNWRARLWKVDRSKCYLQPRHDFEKTQ